MRRPLKGFVLIGLGISLLLALFLSPIASSSPDGLEKVAETKGFAEKAEGLAFWKYAPIPDYVMPRIEDERIATAASGLVGTLAVFLIALGLGSLLRTRPKGTY